MARVLDRVAAPADLRALGVDELATLATEIRDVLVQTISRTGGHLGPNLGIVELTIALHRVFDSPSEPILFDVGHQAYVHKLLTGRAAHLAGRRLRPGYGRVLGQVKDALGRPPVVGQPLYGALHGVKRGLKDMLQPQGMFEDLGLKYFGPVDGHDIGALEYALRLARRFGGPVIVHCVTRKGYGYAPAENDEADQMHQSGAFDPATGLARPISGKSWTKVVGEELAALGEERDDIVAITAAMCEPTGMGAFARRFPDRAYDVGIAEQHALTSAAGLAFGGLHPVVCLYATFLNRAFDQLLMDVALHRLPVTITLDRAGITGNDGPSHNGTWDLAILGVVPGLRIAAPRDELTLGELLREAVAVSDGPTVVRYPKTPIGAELPAVRRVGTVDVLAEPEPGADADVD